MKKIAIAFGIIACLAVLSMLLTSATAQEEEDDDFWMCCPGRFGDLYMKAGAEDPAIVHYVKDVRGIGYADCQSSIATHPGNRGIESTTSTRGTAVTHRDYQTITMDTNPGNPIFNMTSEMNMSYRNVVFSDGLVTPLVRTLSGGTSVASYVTGSAVSEKYMETYDISGEFAHTGNGTHSLTTIANRSVYGTSHFAVTIQDIEDHHHKIMRVRDEYTGSFEMDREVEVVRYIP
ncbi:hypothetical protein C5S53_09155 [Methanophagales archaeon]|nr:hypothetical protein C5S53_09155 [Methanophagales archaeon]